MQINLTPKEFRKLLDLVYIGNWVLNSTRAKTASPTMTIWRANCLPCPRPVRALERNRRSLPRLSGGRDSRGHRLL